jgi:hypothetical protein
MPIEPTASDGLSCALPAVVLSGGLGEGPRWLLLQEGRSPAGLGLGEATEETAGPFQPLPRLGNGHS